MYNSKNNGGLSPPLFYIKLSFAWIAAGKIE
jgi:hypothetical protein